MAGVGDAIDELSKSVDTVEEKWKLLPYFIKTRGLMQQHIESFDAFVEKEIKNIVLAKSNVEIRSDQEESFYMRYLNIRVGSPCLDNDQTTEEESNPLVCNPFQCRLRDCTYSAPLIVDIEYINYTIQQNRQVRQRHIERNHTIGRIPVMLRSSVCVLRGKSPDQLAEMKECAYDPGGYFVIKGVEKVILMQEQLSRNRVIIELDAKNNISAAITSATHDRKSRCNIFYRNNKLYMKHNSLGDEVPIVIVLKAMGLECDQEIVQLIGTEPVLADLLTASLEDAHKLKIYSRSSALKYLKGKIRRLRESNSLGSMKKKRKDGDEDMTDAEVIEILAHNVLNHVPVNEDYEFRPKIIYVTHIVRRVLLTVLDPKLLDDKDYYGNKRLELAGSLISLLFEDLFKRMNSDLKRQIDSLFQKQKMRVRRDIGTEGVNHNAMKPIQLDVKTHFRKDTITQGFIHAISTGNWVLKRFRMDRAGVTQVLSRLSYISALGMMTRVNSQFEKTRKVSGPRSLQPSQWGMMCPADTPEGEACGLVKNLALLAHVTHDADDGSEELIRICFDLGVENIEELTGDESNEEGTYTVIVNGLIIGAHSDPDDLVKRLRKKRRAAKMGEFVSIYLNQNHRTVNIASDGGRVCRPLLVVEDGRLLLTQEHINKLGTHDDYSLANFLRQGIIEYVDVNEENNCLVALHEGIITMAHTHMEIDPLTILGLVAGLVPYPHHNQSPRNTYQCAMGKQAIGATAMNQYERLDSLLYTMIYPQKPMVTTKTMDLFNFNELPGGQNASLAVMSYSGYDIEDAIVLNRGSMDRGFGRCLVVRKHQTSLKKYGHEIYDKSMPLSSQDLSSPKQSKKFDAVDPSDGLAEVGRVIKPGGVMVNKFTPQNTTEGSGQVADINMMTPNRLTYKGPAESIVDKVLLTNNDSDGSRVVKVLVRQCRRPEIGDKFSSRHGQKGVCGLIINQEDMPFSEKGICPDLIMNPHGFPSRMTVGKMIELVSGKAAVFKGRQGYGTAFGEATGSADKIEDVCRELVEMGYSYHGSDIMTSGITGEPIQSYIFAGPVFYQKLKHMVMDKMHSRAKGPRAQLTRQPTEGRSRDGGLRLGEMERDCLIGFGASNLIVERLMISSDSFGAYVCEGCGLLGYENWCQTCRSGEKVSNMTLPYACKLLFQELQSMNIAPRLRLEDF
jgi:DNA-directed RNA polymerase III subunit RPC2